MTDTGASAIAYGFMLAVPALFAFWAGRHDRHLEYQRILFCTIVAGFNSDYIFGSRPGSRWFVFDNMLSLLFIITLNVSLYLGTEAVLSNRKPRGPRVLTLETNAASVASTVAFLFFAYEVMIERAGVRDTATGTISHSHFDALYMLSMTWTTVGYGDLVPVGHWGRLAASLSAVNGYFVFAVIVGLFLPRVFIQRRD